MLKIKNKNRFKLSNNNNLLHFVGCCVEFNYGSQTLEVYY